MEALEQDPVGEHGLDVGAGFPEGDGLDPDVRGHGVVFFLGEPPFHPVGAGVVGGQGQDAVAVELFEQVGEVAAAQGEVSLRRRASRLVGLILVVN